MLTIKRFIASAADTAPALADLERQFADSLPRNLDRGLMFPFYGVKHDGRLISEFLNKTFAGLPFIGGTSSGGLMTDAGMARDDAIGLLVIDDPGGEFGVASGGFDGAAPAEIAKRVLNEALANCGCTGQLPDLIWVYQTPGREEDVVRGLRDVVQDHCPIIGGTAADNDCRGHWQILGPEGPLTEGVVIAVMFPSAPISFAFQGGYEPAGPNGTITSIGFHTGGQSGVVTAGSGRDILTIDGAPAADIYNQWAQDSIHDKLDTGGSILAETTMFPLAIDVGDVDGFSQYLLIHPESVLPARGLRTFREVEVGMRVHAMRGEREQLVARAGRVVEYARMKLPTNENTVAGAIVVYCGGCKLAVGDEISAVASTVSRSLDGAPFIGCFTFGEQGFLRDHNVHGNLMISAIVFGA
jgi:hypothetical protein